MGDASAEATKKVEATKDENNIAVSTVGELGNEGDEELAAETPVPVGLFYTLERHQPSYARPVGLGGWELNEREE